MEKYLNLELFKGFIEDNDSLTLIELYTLVKDIPPFNTYFPDLSNEINASLDKKGFIESHINDIVGIFERGTHDVCGIIQYPEANPLVKYGYRLAVNNPLILVSNVIYGIKEHEYYSGLMMANKHSELSDTKNVIELGPSDLVYECLYFVLFGVRYVVYKSILDGYLLNVANGKDITPVKPKFSLDLRGQVLLLDHVLKLVNNGKSPLDLLTQDKRLSVDNIGILFGYILKGDPTNTRKYIVSGRHHGDSGRDDVYKPWNIDRVNDILRELKIPLISKTTV